MIQRPGNRTDQQGHRRCLPTPWCTWFGGWLWRACLWRFETPASRREQNTQSKTQKARVL